MIRENPPVILIIDDEVLIRESFRDYLTDCGYGVLEAENGKTGVAIFKIEKPDLVLVDLRMPEMDGLEVLMHLQRISPETPVIVISGTGVITDAVDALRKGAWDFLSKPLPELSVLRHTVEKSLERARLISEKINQHKALVMANEELKKAKDLADVATQVKSDFLTNISHEIRTPLNGVVAAADLAIQEENVPPKILHLLEIIRSSARTLNGIINDILDFSRIESGSLTMEAQHFFLDDLIDSVVALGIQKIAEKKIELLVDIDPETPTGLIGDPHRIQQILNHLLDNASKFTDKAGVITMGVSPVESIFGKEEVLLRFFVKDTGIGMTADQMERLFQPFTQADTTTTRKHGGTGLGLSLCKKLIVLMGGDIWAESIPGKGSIFFFTLRLKKEGQHGGKKLIMPGPMQHLRVLVADDAPDSIAVMHRFLESFRLNVVTATSGADAVRLAEEAVGAGSPFDLIILDWVMPEMDGFQAAAIIREKMKLPVSILMMSGFGKEMELDENKRKYMNGFLSKPIHIEALYKAITDIFRYGRTDQERESGKGPWKANGYEERIRGIRVLIAEDNPTNQAIVREILENIGAVVRTAKTGREAIRLFQKEPFDAILMDVQMPEYDGCETTRRIREIESWTAEPSESIPIIAMTGYVTKEDEEKCLEAGMNAYIPKPIKWDMLLKTLCTLVTRRSGKSEIATSPVPGKPIETGLPESIPGVDIRLALDTLRIPPEEFKTVLEGFRANYLNLADLIRKAIEIQEWKRVIDLAHDLKGTSANIRAVRLEKAASELLQVARRQAETDGGVLPDSASLDGLTDALNEVLQSIARLQRPPGAVQAQPPAAPDIPRITRILPDLLLAMKQSQPERVRYYWAEICACIEEKRVLSISESIEKYEFDEAIERIILLSRQLGISLKKEGEFP